MPFAVLIAILVAVVVAMSAVIVYLVVQGPTLEDDIELYTKETMKVVDCMGINGLDPETVTIFIEGDLDDDKLKSCYKDTVLSQYINDGSSLLYVKIQNSIL